MEGKSKLFLIGSGSLLAKEKLEGILIGLEAAGCIEGYEIPKNPLSIENIDYLGLLDSRLKESLETIGSGVYDSGIYVAKCSVKDIEKMEETHKSLLERADIRQAPYHIIPFFFIDEINKI